MRIIELKAENIKRLSAVDITPAAGGLVVIAGRNAQGKSSVLDAIAMALGGTKLAPKQPIKAGESRAEITVDLGDYVVTRTFARDPAECDCGAVAPVAPGTLELVHEGNDLDDDGLALLGQIAGEHDAQVWLERIAGAGDGVAIVIEDGAVRA